MEHRPRRRLPSGTLTPPPTYFPTPIQELPPDFEMKKGPPSLPYDGWTPMKDGVTQSLLQKFVGCRDRFHKHVVMGLRETTRKEAMEYGSLFHKLIEVGATLHNPTREKIVGFMEEFLIKHYPSVDSRILGRIAIAQYIVYREWVSTRPSFRYIEAEPVFHQPFNLPPMTFNPNPDIMLRVPEGVIIPLRGRIDGVIEKDGELWLEENKTKSRVDIPYLQDTIHSNIQVMFYAVAAQIKYGRPCKGVIYNVIRKPALRQGKKETFTDFILRNQVDMIERPHWYFNRLEVRFQPGDIERWQRDELLPLLYNVYFWWRSIESDPKEPWNAKIGNPENPELVVNPFHLRKSFGIYDALTNGKGEFYDLIVYNKTDNLKVVHEAFPELQDDTEDGGTEE